MRIMKIVGPFFSGIKRPGAAIITAVLFLSVTVCFARIQRLDVYDKTDNKLMFVTFQYDAAGKNTVRDVFAADSTFLRHTSLQFNAQNQVIKESSINFDSALVFYTNISSSGTSSTFSVFDQFNLDQFGGAMSSSTSDQVTYTISQGGAAINKIKYTLVGGSVQRIDVGDNNGVMLYYALTDSSQVGLRIARQPSAAQRPSVTALGKGHFKVFCNLLQPANLTLELFNISGRRAAVVMNKQFGPGAHSIKADAFASRPKTLSNGAYIVRLAIDGKQVVDMLSIIQK
jgi:hypothetical protein